jgi:RimJ/RimL family protein N-acetyltransferase
MTLRYVYGQNDTVARFVAQQIPHVDRGFPRCETIGVVDANDRLVAGVVYYYWNKRNGTIEVAAGALPGRIWFTRETMRRMADYAFTTCGCQMAIMRVREEDERLLAQLARFGCAFVKVPRLYGRDSDGVMCLLADDEYAKRLPAHERREAA